MKYSRNIFGIENLSIADFHNTINWITRKKKNSSSKNECDFLWKKKTEIRFGLFVTRISDALTQNSNAIMLSRILLNCVRCVNMHLRLNDWANIQWCHKNSFPVISTYISCLMLCAKMFENVDWIRIISQILVWVFYHQVHFQAMWYIQYMKLTWQCNLLDLCFEYRHHSIQFKCSSIVYFHCLFHSNWSIVLMWHALIQEAFACSVTRVHFLCCH